MNAKLHDLIENQRKGHETEPRWMMASSCSRLRREYRVLLFSVGEEIFRCGGGYGPRKNFCACARFDKTADLCYNEEDRRKGVN